MSNPIQRREHAAPLVAAARQGLTGAQLFNHLMQATGGDYDAALRMALDTVVQLRRQDVATLGSSEVFVRRSAEGDMMQVIRPVTLSLKDGTLHNIDGRYMISATGLQRMDEVVGASKAVDVDVDDGPPMRIHVRVRLVAASPVTGNPVMIDYRHTEEPERMLLEYLGKFAAEAPKSCKVCAREDTPQGWGFRELYDGEGYAYDRSHAAYYKKGIAARFNEVLRFAKRRGITIAIRNAQRKHPAFGGRVQFAGQGLQDGTITIPVTGWTGSEQAVSAMARLQQMLADQMTLPADVEIIDGNAAEDPADQLLEPPAEPDEAQALPGADEIRWRELREILDMQWEQLSTDQRRGLVYAPEDMDVDDMEALQRDIAAVTGGADK